MLQTYPGDLGGKIGLDHPGQGTKFIPATRNRISGHYVPGTGLQDQVVVLRLVATANDSRGAHYTSLIDIFNLSSGWSVYQAAREFGEKSSCSDSKELVPRPPPNTVPGGFIRPWPGTPRLFCGVSK